MTREVLTVVLGLTAGFLLATATTQGDVAVTFTIIVLGMFVAHS